jgi:hypothetical protein
LGQGESSIETDSVGAEAANAEQLVVEPLVVAANSSVLLRERI